MRGIALSFILWILSAGVAWPASGPPIVLRDDRGEKIASPLEVCFQGTIVTRPRARVAVSFLSSRLIANLLYGVEARNSMIVMCQD
jgi:hypothetical protein